MSMALICACQKDIDPERKSYYLHSGITATVFWVGEGDSGAPYSCNNHCSAWDSRWVENFGGIDNPYSRRGHRPAGFIPKQNPFYIALPYGDMAGHARRKMGALQAVPWSSEKVWGDNESLCKNRWVRLIKNGKVAYAQWEDVGPFETDDTAYVFGVSRPRNRSNGGAGIDVSPAVRDTLGLGGMDVLDWQFVQDTDVPDGPWKKTITSSQICER